MKHLVLMFLFGVAVLAAQAQHKEDAILGKWMYEEKNLIVEVYKDFDDIKARIVWFHDDDDTITPLEERLDLKNPDTSLRWRRLIGLDILSNLVYDKEDDRWIKGKIYDSSSGKTWDSTVWLEDANTMKVRGYYIFRFVGKTLTFSRL